MNATAPKCSCSCNDEPAQPALVYSCSGAADTGELADRAARRLDAEEKAWMSCLAGIGGRVSGLMASAAAAPVLLAIDGCPQDCARKTLELAGFHSVRHLRVTDLGLKKGQSPVTAEAIDRVVAAATALLQTKSCPPSS
jgi:uncharacterized metal-binding protein